MELPYLIMTTTKARPCYSWASRTSPIGRIRVEGGCVQVFTPSLAAWKSARSALLALGLKLTPQVLTTTIQKTQVQPTYIPWSSATGQYLLRLFYKKSRARTTAVLSPRHDLRNSQSLPSALMPLAKNNIDKMTDNWLHKLDPHRFIYSVLGAFDMTFLAV